MGLGWLQGKVNQPSQGFLLTQIWPNRFIAPHGGLWVFRVNRVMIYLGRYKDMDKQGF